MAARFYPVVFLFSRRRLLPSHFQPWASSSSWWPPSFTSTPDPRWSTDPSITTTAAAATTSSTTPASVEKLNQLKVQKRLRCIFDFLKFPVWKKLFRFFKFLFRFRVSRSFRIPGKMKKNWRLFLPAPKFWWIAAVIENIKFFCRKCGSTCQESASISLGRKPTWHLLMLLLKHCPVVENKQVERTNTILVLRAEQPWLC